LFGRQDSTLPREVKLKGIHSTSDLELARHDLLPMVLACVRQYDSALVKGLQTARSSSSKGGLTLRTLGNASFTKLGEDEIADLRTSATELNDILADVRRTFLSVGQELAKVCGSKAGC
jgi:hypothetical protein